MRELRLTIEYRDINSALTIIEVWQEGMTAEGTKADGQSTPLTIAWGDNAGDDFPTIYASTATVRFYQDEEGQFTDLFSSNEFKNLVKIYKTGTLIWTGFIKGDTWEEERSSGLLPVQFTAVDMLTSLKNKPFDMPGVHARYEPISLIIEVILQGFTGLDLPILHSINWETDKGAHYLESIVDVEYLKGRKCYDVLENLLFGCRVFQREAYWYIMAYSQIENDSINFDLPDGFIDDFYSTDFREGDFRTRIQGTDTQLRYLIRLGFEYWFESRLSLELLQGVRNIIISENQGYRDNLIKNGDFSEGFDNWQQTGFPVFPIPGVKKKIEGDKEVFYAYLPEPSAFYDDIFLHQTIGGFVNSAEKLRIRFKYGIIGTSETANANMYVQIRLISNNYANYYYATYDVTADGLALTWTTTETNLRLAARQENGVILNDTISCNSDYRDYSKKLRSFDLITDDIEIAGMLQIKFFVPATGANVTAAIYTDVQVQVYDDAGDVYDNDNEITLTVDDDNTTDYEKELFIVQGPEINNISNAYGGALLLANNSQPTGWRRVGYSDYFDLNLFKALIMRRLMLRPRYNYHATVADVKADMRIIISDAESATGTARRLIENGVSYDDYMNTIEGQFTEIL